MKESGKESLAITFTFQTAVKLTNSHAECKQAKSSKGISDEIGSPGSDERCGLLVILVVVRGPWYPMHMISQSMSLIKN